MHVVPLSGTYYVRKLRACCFSKVDCDESVARSKILPREASVSKEFPHLFVPTETVQPKTGMSIACQKVVIAHGIDVCVC